MDDPVARGTLRMVFHFRRYLMLYVVGIVAGLVLILLPTVEGGGGQLGPAASGAAGAGAGPVSSGGTANAAAVSGAAVPGAGTSAGGTGGLSGAAGSGATGPDNGGGPIGAVQQGAGTTRGGFACSRGVGQLPWATYAAPCVAAFSGNNGGAPTRGVTSDSITIAVRVSSDASGPNQQAVDAASKAAGGVTAADNWNFIQTLTDYFNKTFELYGRKVRFVKFNGQGNDTNESLGQGEAAACADADQAATTLHAFAIVDFSSGLLTSQPLSDCAARYHLYAPEGADYFPESFYQQWDPYVWSITMNCTTIAQGGADFYGKQLYPYPAKWAGNDGLVNLNGMHRKLAVYVPNNAGYQSCTDYAKQLSQQKYHEDPKYYDQYNYALDISTFPQDAQNAIVKFAADQDTTIELACDPLSPVFMTQDARNQNYHPEWMLIGVALTDTDNFGQLWDQTEVNGHLFGLSQNGDEKQTLDPNGEVTRTWEAASGQKSLQNPEIALDYFALIAMFDQFQAAGPTLTAQNIAVGTHRLPILGGASPVAGTWDWTQGHTAIVDSREIYWDGNQKSAANGNQGTYVQIYNGRRFRAGQYPTGEPPYYP